MTVKSDLLLIGNDHLLFDLDARYNFGGGDWSLLIYMDFVVSITGEPLNIGDQLIAFLKVKFISLNTNVFFIYTADGETVKSVGIPFVFDSYLKRKTHFVFQREGDDLNIYVNGVFIGAKVNEFSGKTFDLSGLEGRVGDTSTSGNTKVSDFMVLNRALTLPEIKVLYNHNLVPESTHLNIIKHLPITEAFAFKADAAFVANHSEFNVGDNVFLDVVEQYNYAKGSPLTPQHAKTVNYADADVGLSNDDVEGAIFDFYNKNGHTFAYSKFNGVDSKVSMAHAADLTFGDGAGANVSFALTGHFVARANLARFFMKGQELSSTNRQYFVSVSGVGLIEFIIFGVGAAVLKVGTYAVTFGKRYHFNANYDSAAANIQLGMSLRVWEDGALVQDVQGASAPAHTDIVASAETQLIGAGDNLHSDADISDVRVHNAPLSLQEATRVKNGEPSGKEISGWLLNGKPTIQSATTVEDVYGSNDGTTTNIIRGPERGSLLPLLEDSFNIDETFSIQAPTSLGDAIADTEVSVMLTIKLPLAALPQAATRYIIRWGSVTVTTLQIDSAGKVQARTGEFIDLFAAGSAETQIFTIFLNNKFEITGSDNCLTWKDAALVEKTKNLVASDVTGENLTISGIDQDVEIIRCGVWSRLLSIREMLELSDNTLLANPTSEQQVGLEAFYNMNLSSFSEDGANVFLEDHSGNARDAIVTGLTGGSSAAQLADVPNHLSNISTDLR